tara:strand:- start:77 stop:682 length:606 start_codon:yes stop_codon:yes gene_type:complete
VNQYLYGKDLYFSFRTEVSKVPHFEISEEFIKRYYWCDLDSPEIQELEEYSHKYYKVGPSILFLHVSLSVVEGLNIKNARNEIITALKKIKEKTKLPLYIKQHPNFTEDITYIQKEIDIIELPSYYPAEAIDYSHVSYVVTLSSSTNISKLIPKIYILNLLTWKSDVSKHYWLKMITDRQDDAFVPKNMKMFDKVIDELVG